MIEGKVVVTKSWRSELWGLVVYVVLLVASPVLSDVVPESVIRGPLFSVGSRTIYLSLPLFWLVPMSALLYLIARMYDVWYVIDRQGIEAWTGILSLRQSITRLRHEDVRSIETDQTVMERLLDVGEVRVATAATDSVEVVFQGVASPKALQAWLQAERDEVQKRLRNKIQEMEKIERNVATSNVTNFTEPSITTNRSSAL